MGKWHVGRQWVGHDVEDDCPCPQEPCGLVDPSRAAPECPHHHMTSGKSLRQCHLVADCPGGEP